MQFGRDMMKGEELEASGDSSHVAQPKKKVQFAEPPPEQPKNTRIHSWSDLFSLLTAPRRRFVPRTNSVKLLTLKHQTTSLNERIEELEARVTALTSVRVCYAALLSFP